MNKKPLFNLSIFNKPQKKERILVLEYQSYVLKAEELMKRSDYSGAIAALSKAIEKIANSHEAYLSRSLSYFNLSDFDRALEDVNKLIKIKGDLTKALFHKAKILKALHKNKEALKYIQKIETIETIETQEYFLLKASIELDLGMFQEALTDFSKTLNLAPNCLDGLFSRGVAKYYLGDILGSLNDIRKALTLASENGDFNIIKTYFQRYSFIGTIYYLAGKHHVEVNNKKSALNCMFSVKEVYSIYKEV